ncbi:hypothetical protein F5890DRAFT_1550978 [Lentinula detonsa]|uniref:Uncharacterized protein n=1 Tax=Lentinula detonsa TaxID=2804962 RepID=A0AA38UVA9_9AGAR|nr:hypothetical protein F5890DRAFT_1550978 [Lentinula detonsa]
MNSVWSVRGASTSSAASTASSVSSTSEVSDGGDNEAEEDDENSYQTASNSTTTTPKRCHSHDNLRRNFDFDDSPVSVSSSMGTSAASQYQSHEVSSDPSIPNKATINPL